MPVSAFIPRRALREVELGGHRLAAGTAVAAAVGLLGHHPDWWTNPRLFDPDRFAPERAEDKRHPALFLPFGAGAHGCVGMQLAGIEAKLLWHALLSRCRFELAEPYQAEHTYTPLGCVSGKVALKFRAL
jgi:cytochrome P450